MTATKTVKDSTKAPTRDELVAQAKKAGVTGAVSRMTVAQLQDAIKATEPNAARKAEDARIKAAAERAVNGTSGGQASENPTERGRLAKAEFKALQAWEKAGSKGERPATPNYDVVSAKATGQDAKTKKAAKSGGTKGQRTVSSRRDGEKHDITARGREARDARKAKGGRRGQGKKLDHDALVKYCAKVQAAHDDAWWYDELYYAHWVEGIAVAPERFQEAWDEAAKTKAAKPATKAVASRKVTAAKKAPAKKGAAK